MLFISKDYGNNTYGVTDTITKTEKVYTYDELAKQKEQGVDIRGFLPSRVVVYDNEDSLYRALQFRHSLLDGNLVYDLDCNLCSVKNKFDLPERLVIPEFTKAIYSGVFEKALNIKSVVIPERCTSIGEEAFSECKNLKSIEVMGNNPIKLGRSCFSSTAWLEGTDGVVGDYRMLNDSTMVSYLGNEKVVTIPDSIRSIGARAFDSRFEKYATLARTNVTLDELANGLNEVNAIEEVLLPNTIEFIGEEAFGRCEHLKRIEVPSSVRAMGAGVFAECSQLVYAKINTSLDVLPMCTFADCDSLQKVELPSTLKAIGSNCFINCSSLKSIDLPSSVEIISDNCFKDCYKLAEINFNGKFTTIGSEAFSSTAFEGKFRCYVIIGGYLYGCNRYKPIMNVPDNVKIMVVMFFRCVMI